MANVTMIPARDIKPEILRVAAYCRVSSDSTDQLHSYAAQIRVYTEMIRCNPKWTLVDIYADEGITGTRDDKRDEFQRMMNDCRKGRIDRIIVKSVSRFARNTKECLSAIRELNSFGITILFEEDNIDTETLTSELLVSVSGAIAQQESLSISQNQKISYQHRMERGEFITCKAPYGYQLTDGKNLEIVPEEAEHIRWMFASYLGGKSTRWIAEEMTKCGVLTTDGTPYWQESTISYILTNEKYIGDTLCQKTYTSGFPFIQTRNQGSQPQYYIENTHPAIISKETFEKAKKLYATRAQRMKVQRSKSPFAQKVICGICGTKYIRRTTDKGNVFWTCRKHNGKAATCSSCWISEKTIERAFVRMFQKLAVNEQSIISPALYQLERFRERMQRNNQSLLRVNEELAQLSEQSYRISKLQSAGILDVALATAKLNTLNAKMLEIKHERVSLMECSVVDECADSLANVRRVIHQRDEIPTAFDIGLFEELVEKILVKSQDSLCFRLYGGIELTEYIEEHHDGK